MSAKNGLKTAHILHRKIWTSHYATQWVGDIPKHRVSLIPTIDITLSEHLKRDGEFGGANWIKSTLQKESKNFLA